jgi:hypothetical protein
MVGVPGRQHGRSRQIAPLIIELFATAKNDFVDFPLNAGVSLTEFSEERCHQGHRRQNM